MAEYRGIAPMDMSGNVSENWKFWIQKFKNYLVATEINKKQEVLQCAQLLQYIGDDGFKIFNTFEFTTEERNKIEILITKFDEYFQPKKNLVYERHKLLSRKQLEGENIQHYVTDLRNKAKNCELGELEESLVCSVMICGLTSNQLRERLLENDDLDLSKAIKICLAVEESKKHGQEISETADVNVVRATNFKKSPFKDRSLRGHGHYGGGSGSTSAGVAGPSSSKNRPSRGNESTGINSTTWQKQPFKKFGNKVCSRCGSCHQWGKCPAYGKQCSGCGTYNHFIKMCKNKNVHIVNTGDNDLESSISDDFSDNVFIGMINKCENNVRDKEWNIDLTVNNIKKN